MKFFTDWLRALRPLFVVTVFMIVLEIAGVPSQNWLNGFLFFGSSLWTIILLKRVLGKHAIAKKVIYGVSKPPKNL